MQAQSETVDVVWRKKPEEWVIDDSVRAAKPADQISVIDDPAFGLFYCAVLRTY